MSMESLKETQWTYRLKEDSSVINSAGFLSVVIIICSVIAIMGWGCIETISLPLITVSIFAVALLGLVGQTGPIFGVAGRIFCLVYVLPFVVQCRLLWSSDLTWWETPMAVSLSCQQGNMAAMLLMALTGLLGLQSGIMIYNALRPNLTRSVRSVFPISQQSVSLVIYVVLIAIALVLAHAGASKGTIFSTVYGGKGDQVVGFLHTIKFRSGLLIAYLIFILCYIDASAEKSGTDRIYKKVLLLVASLWTIVWLQLLRGDRECSGLILAISALAMTRFPHHVWRQVTKHSVKLGIIAIIFLVLGFARSRLSNGDMSFLEADQLQKMLTYNTWTSVALTNLGCANEYMSGMDWQLGKTYWDYVLSFPPGFLTSWLGLERPLDGESSPLRWYEFLTSGGVHVAVVPFRNFGPIGLWLVLCAYGMTIAAIDRLAYSQCILDRFLFGTFICVSMLWFWYGDNNIIRALTAFFCLKYLYTFFQYLRSTTNKRQRLTVILGI